MHLEIHCTTPSIRKTDLWFIRKNLVLSERRLDVRLGEVSLALVGDRTMSALHQRYLSIAGPTDVLTFPLEHGSEKIQMSGDVVICVPEARRRCRENGLKVREELLLYALHGLLHLCGYDDRTDLDFERMHAMEDLILQQIGVGPLFAAANRAGNP